MIKSSDEHWMGKALELAKLGQGYVEPNPMVGCAVVCDGELIASGFHERFGGPHAEVNALRDLDPTVLLRSTLYVTLEPCAHYGKTPPCAELLVNKPAKRVVIAMQDPFDQVAGRGIARLQQAGIDVTLGVLENQARALNAPYIKRLTRGLPWVIAKWAMSLDGAIATESGDSKWISCEESRQEVHRLRSRVDAIMVGSSTVLADDPQLTARLADGQSPIRRASRWVLDRRFRIPERCRLVESAKEPPVVVVADRRSLSEQISKRRALEAAGVEFLELDEHRSESSAAGLTYALEQIARRGGTNVLVEGGAEVLGCLFDARLVDQIECYIAPMVIGGERARRPVGGVGFGKIAESVGFSHERWEICGRDIHFTGVISGETSQNPAG